MAHFRHQVMLDEETSGVIDELPEKKKSEYVRTAIKAFEASKKQKELDSVRPNPPTFRVKLHG